MGHCGDGKLYSNIKSRYYWPNLFKNANEYVSNCVTCKTRNLKAIKPPTELTDIPPYPFAKVGLDLPGPYLTSISGNRYIIAFICLYSGYVEAFPMKNKSADNVCHYLIDIIFRRYGAMLSIVTDNGTEFVNKKFKETLQELNVQHITTSFYHPQSNAKVERFHRTLHDTLSKKLYDDHNVWDLFLLSTLAAINFSENESTKFSPFFLLYNRDVVLPLDNILKPRRKYHGEDLHQLALEIQHKSFISVHRHLKKAKRRQAFYADRKSKEINFQIGDPVYLKNLVKKNQFDVRWKPYYRIISQSSPVSFVVKNQLDGTTTKAHAEHLRHANIDEWEIPSTPDGIRTRRAHYVVSPESESDEHNDSDNDSRTPNTNTSNQRPIRNLADKHRTARDDSSSEDDIPLAEFANRIRRRERRQRRQAD
ncbi:hypothetical protein FSP39_022015 [Pinctada imbricata]|uniref:Integrase catalytic domain-containing protein n=1 Tax=Pinctada imbricata TaxID=66713 RepID=A0AA89CBH2_PINIB|nr:hypothetical protein FSP39_022015 [Pinctada imbricata]